MTASELRAAADTLDRHADSATAGPWVAHGGSVDGAARQPVVMGGFDSAGSLSDGASVEDAAFIAVMDPALAKDEAYLLRIIAAFADQLPQHVIAAALAVARAVNKEKP